MRELDSGVTFLRTRLLSCVEDDVTINQGRESLDLNSELDSQKLIPGGTKAASTVTLASASTALPQVPLSTHLPSSSSSSSQPPVSLQTYVPPVSAIASEIPTSTIKSVLPSSTIGSLTSFSGPSIISPTIEPSEQATISNFTFKDCDSDVQAMLWNAAGPDGKLSILIDGQMHKTELPQEEDLGNEELPDLTPINLEQQQGDSLDQEQEQQDETQARSDRNGNEQDQDTRIIQSDQVDQQEENLDLNEHPNEMQEQPNNQATSSAGNPQRPRTITSIRGISSGIGRYLENRGQHESQSFATLHAKRLAIAEAELEAKLFVANEAKMEARIRREMAEAQQQHEAFKLETEKKQIAFIHEQETKLWQLKMDKALLEARVAAIQLQKSIHEHGTNPDPAPEDIVHKYI